jgi:hypothetical protein
MKSKVTWMKEWCDKEGLGLTLEGECGFGRECVGVHSLNDETYPDYEWYDDNYENRIDPNGEVWIPQNAYHKHPCVAVLGRSKESINQLYTWLKWFEENNFHYKQESVECKNEIELIMGRDKHHMMVKNA